MVSKQRVYLTKDGKNAVPAGHPDATSLLIHEGGEIAEKTLSGIKGASDLCGRTFEENDGGVELPADGLEGLLLNDLKSLASGDGIDLAGATKKADVIAAIRAHRAANPKPE